MLSETANTSPSDSYQSKNIIGPYEFLDSVCGLRLSSSDEFTLFCNSQCKAPLPLGPHKPRSSHLPVGYDAPTHYSSVPSNLIFTALLRLIKKNALTESELVSISEVIASALVTKTDEPNDGHPRIESLLTEISESLKYLKSHNVDESASRLYDFESTDRFKEIEHDSISESFSFPLVHSPKLTIYSPNDNFFSTFDTLQRTTDSDDLNNEIYYIKSILIELNESDPLTTFSTLQIRDYSFILSSFQARIMSRFYSAKTEPLVAVLPLIDLYLSFIHMCGEYVHGLETLVLLTEATKNREDNVGTIPDDYFDTFLLSTTLGIIQLPFIPSVDDSQRLFARLPPLGVYLYRIALKNMLFTTDSNSMINTFALWSDHSYLTESIATLTIGNITITFSLLQARVVLKDDENVMVFDMPRSERFEVDIFVDSPDYNPDNVKNDSKCYNNLHRALKIYLSGVEIVSIKLSTSISYIELALTDSSESQRLHPLTGSNESLKNWGKMLKESNMQMPSKIKTLEDLIEVYLIAIHRLSYNFSIFGTNGAVKFLRSISSPIFSSPALIKCKWAISMLVRDVTTKFNTNSSSLFIKLLVEEPYSKSPEFVLHILTMISNSRLYELMVQAPADGIEKLLLLLSSLNLDHKNDNAVLDRVVKFATPRFISYFKDYKFEESRWYKVFQCIANQSVHHSPNPIYLLFLKHGLLHIAAFLSQYKAAPNKYTLELFNAASMLASKSLDISIRAEMSPSTSLLICIFCIIVNPSFPEPISDQSDQLRLQRLTCLLAIWPKLLACCNISNSFTGLYSQISLYLCDYLRALDFSGKIDCKILAKAKFIPELAKEFQVDSPILDLFQPCMKCLTLVSTPNITVEKEPNLLFTNIKQTFLPSSFNVQFNPPEMVIQKFDLHSFSLKKYVIDASNHIFSILSLFASSDVIYSFFRRYSLFVMSKLQEYKSNSGVSDKFTLNFPDSSYKFERIELLEDFFIAEIHRRCRLFFLLFSTNPNIKPESLVYRGWRSNSLPFLVQSDLIHSDTTDKDEPSNVIREDRFNLSDNDLYEMLYILTCGPTASSILLSLYSSQLQSFLFHLGVKSLLVLDGTFLAQSIARASLGAVSLGYSEKVVPFSDEILDSLSLAISKIMPANSKFEKDPFLILFVLVGLGPFSDSRVVTPFIKQLFSDDVFVSFISPLLWIFLVGVPQHPKLLNAQRALIWGVLQLVKLHLSSLDDSYQLEPSNDYDAKNLLVDMQNVFERVTELTLVKYLFEAILATFVINSKHARTGAPLSQLLEIAIRKLYFLENQSNQINLVYDNEEEKTPKRFLGENFLNFNVESPSSMSTVSADRLQGEYLYSWLPPLGAVPPYLLPGQSPSLIPHKLHIEDRYVSSNLVSNEFYLSQGPSTCFYPILSGRSFASISIFNGDVQENLGGIVIFPIPDGLTHPPFQQAFEGMQTFSVSFTICTPGAFGVTVAPADVVFSNVSELFNRNDAVAFVSEDSLASEYSPFKNIGLDRYATSVEFFPGNVLDANFSLHADSNAQCCLRTELMIGGNSIGSILEVIYDPETQKDPCRRMSLIFILPSTQAVVFKSSSSSSEFNHSESSENLQSEIQYINESITFIDRIQLYQSILMVDFKLLGSLKSILIQRWIDKFMQLLVENKDITKFHIPGWIAVLGCDYSKEAMARAKNSLLLNKATAKLGKEFPLPSPLPWLSTHSSLASSPIGRMDSTLVLSLLKFITPSLEWWHSPTFLVVIVLLIKKVKNIASLEYIPYFESIATTLYTKNHVLTSNVQSFSPHTAYHKGDVYYWSASLADLNLELLELIPNFIVEILSNENDVTTASIANRNAGGFFQNILSLWPSGVSTGDVNLKEVWSVWLRFILSYTYIARKVPIFLEAYPIEPSYIAFLLELHEYQYNEHVEKLLITRISSLSLDQIKLMPPNLINTLYKYKDHLSNKITDIYFTIEDIGAFLIDSISTGNLVIVANFDLKISRHYERYRISQALHELAYMWAREALMSPPILAPSSSPLVNQFRRIAFYYIFCSKSSLNELPNFLIDSILGPTGNPLHGNEWIKPLKGLVDHFFQISHNMRGELDGLDSLETDVLICDNILRPADNRLLSCLSSGNSVKNFKDSPVFSDFVKINNTFTSLSKDQLSIARWISRVADSIRLLRSINSCAYTTIPLISPLFANPHVYYINKAEKYYVPLISPNNGPDVNVYLRGKRYLLKQNINELWSKGILYAKTQNVTGSTKPYFSVRVDRTILDGTLERSLVYQSTPQILACDPSVLLTQIHQKPFMVVFKGERSTDFGGPFHEFLSSIADEISKIPNFMNDNNESTQDFDGVLLMQQSLNLTNGQGDFQDSLFFSYSPQMDLPAELNNRCNSMIISDNKAIETLSCWFGCCDLPSGKCLSKDINCSRGVLNQCQCGGAQVCNSSCSLLLPRQLRIYEALGRICAMCASMSVPFNILLNPLVWKKLLLEVLSSDDLRVFDEGTLSRISGILEGDFGDLRFQIEDAGVPGGLANLVENGNDISVTKENVDEYIRLVLLYKINQGNVGLTWFAKGFGSVLPLGIIRLAIDARVVEFMVCGDPEIDLEVLRRHTHSTSNQLLQQFFSIVSGFTNQQLMLLLRFVSGRSRLPPAHLTDWKFRIEYDTDPSNADQRLPTSATCNFRLLIPKYSSMEIFREKLLYAISNCIAIDLDV